MQKFLTDYVSLSVRGHTTIFHESIRENLMTLSVNLSIPNTNTSHITHITPTIIPATNVSRSKNCASAQPDTKESIGNISVNSNGKTLMSWDDKQLRAKISCTIAKRFCSSDDVHRARSRCIRDCFPFIEYL